LSTFQLTLFGVGMVIGTGIFVLTSVAAQKAGPGMVGSFLIAGLVCAATAFCYGELASLVPVSGSAYAYAYAVLGELVAWMVGWALILEYLVSASAVAVGWSNYLHGLLQRTVGVSLPPWLAKGYFAGGVVDLPAIILTLAVTRLLIVGTRETAFVNSIFVIVKLAALVVFIIFAGPAVHVANFEPFAPTGLSGIGSAAASIFFAYVGFDAVATAAEETRNPQRALPIALVANLLICTLLYVFVAAAAIGAVGAQPLESSPGHPIPVGSQQFVEACAAIRNSIPLVCSEEPLAYVLQIVGHSLAATAIGLCAFSALPSVVMLSIFAQTRIVFSMARDGLLPRRLSALHSKFGTPHVVTLITSGVIIATAGLFPMAELADLANAGTLFAFFAVSVGVLVLRKRAPHLERRFRVPAIWLVGPAAACGCMYLMSQLSRYTLVAFCMWTGIGAAVYGFYGYRRSRLALGNANGPQAGQCVAKMVK
jgi:APA family basic amino acid/polyamine antiporter